jgi:class 3 adenylate cyclase
MSADPSMREERRVVTALAADLAGSTAIAEYLDPEETRLVVGEAVSRMVHAVEEFGGTVKDLAGDGILALFGAPTAHEDDAERALRAALRIVEHVREFSRDVERSFGVDSLAVRVGVDTGTVVLGPVGAGSRTARREMQSTSQHDCKLQQPSAACSQVRRRGASPSATSTGAIGRR